VADFYTNIAGTASKLITKYGKPVAIHREIGGTFDGGTGEETGSTTDIQNVIMVVLPATSTKIASLDKQYNLGSLTYKKLNWGILSGSGLDFAPELGNNIVINSEKWEIVGITPLNPNDGAVITYEIAFTI